MQPQIVEQVLKIRGAGESGAGFVAAIEFGAIAIGSMVLARTIRRGSYLLIGIVGIVVALMGAAISVKASNYSMLVAARLITGLGESAALMVSTAAVAQLENPDKAYAQLNIVNILLGAGVTFLLPVLAAHGSGNITTFDVLLGVLIVLFVPLSLIPASVRIRPEDQRSTGGVYGSIRVRISLLAGAVFLVAVASGAMWSFYFVLGLRVGLSEGAVNSAIGLAVLSAVPAGALASILMTRVGRFPPMAAGLVVIAVVIPMMITVPGALIYRVGICINVSGIYFLVPYFYSFAAAEDSSGRGAAVVGGAFLLTGCLGPYLGGLLIQYVGLSSIAWLGVGANAVAGAVFYWLQRGLRHRAEELIAPAPF